LNKRLYRSSTNKVVGGVCGGLGAYLEVDPVLIRIIAVLLTLGHGIGLIAYIVAWIIMPKQSEGVAPSQSQEPPPPWHKYLPGLILVALGSLLLVREYWFWFSWGEFWPILLIVAGLLLVFKRSSCGWRSNESVRGGLNGQNSGMDNNGGIS